MPDYALQRRMMVDGQLRTYDVTDADVLAAFLEVPREVFLGPQQQEFAYVDRTLPLPGSDPRERPRELMTPMVFGRLVQAARLRPGERVLDVGCGTGYSAAVLSKMGASVTALESEPGLVAESRARLPRAGVVGVEVVEGPLVAGWPVGAPFDVIVVNGAFLIEPVQLLEQLAPEGRLVGVKGEGRAARALVYRRSGNVTAARPVFDAAAPVLDAFRPEPSFVF